MNESNNKARNEVDEQDRSGNTCTCTIHHEENRLFCTDCQEVLCIECMLKKHQKHSIINLVEALDKMKQQIEQLCSDEATLLGIKTSKEKLQNLMETCKLANLTSENDLRKRESELKDEITKGADQLSLKLKTAFQKYDTRLQQNIEEVAECEKGIEQLDIASMSLNDMLDLSCRIKTIQSKEFQEKIDTLIQPRLSLTTYMNTSVGNVEPHPDETKMSQVAKTNIKETKVYPIQISATYSSGGYSRTLYEITKLVPVGNEEAWIISSRKIFHLNNSEINVFPYSSFADDIVWPGDDDLLVMRQDSQIINKITCNAYNSVIIFTRTEPYYPASMTYLEKENSVMILMKENIIFAFGLDGIKTKSISVPIRFRHLSGDCLEVVSDTEFLSVHRPKLLGYNSINSFTGKPLQHKSFAGIFGCEPSSIFTCKGICYDDNGFLIVSDYMFNTIYRLDKDMKVNKILIEQQSGLTKPSAIALKDGLLWIADEKRISIYRYSDISFNFMYLLSI